MKIITLYNHKGGVSKTTTTFNLAHLLAERGGRVLVVDADPQCNLTELLISQTIQEADTKEADTGVPQPLPGSTILEALRPRIDGDVPEVDIDSVELIPVSPNMLLLRGDVNLSDIEDSLAEAHTQRFSNKTHEKRTYVAMGSFIERLAVKHSIDYVLIDVGPSSGALTRACFLVCDGFFVPSMPDRFNVQAIGTLSTILRRWISEHQQIYASFIDQGLPIRPGTPLFLGIISQNFKMISGKPKKSYELWISRMPGRYSDKLKPALDGAIEGVSLSQGITAEDCIVAKIPDFVGLAPLMQETGKPVFGIEKNDTRIVNEGHPWQGKVWDQAVERMTSYKSELSRLAERVETLS
ncbi:ParA family protein [Microvirga sp. SRT01]|uniref:ParA family protein n=1 Tax=Sphingomonas longa TaxID=2778730 RepID=A0ABS2D8T6_9SPHN|nr:MULTISPECIES: ParA family protein [Alphaproteobacteria]MBM6576464.1 ParA family protein [Sphingomonas sp. BT552]MBR7709510.1 ParA family protein [Microvirga sp. SRT01]